MAIILSAAGSGDGDSAGDYADGVDLASEEETLRDKLSLCADEWNADGAEWNSPISQDPSVLVSTTPQGQCVVVFSESSGQLPAWVVERNPFGEWGTFINSETTNRNNLQTQLALAESFNLERLTTPNAWIVGQGYPEAIVEFNPEAPVPASAQVQPSLLTNPTSENCGDVVTFTGGTIGDFYLTVEDAAGISCGEAVEIARDFPFFVEEWSCGGERRLECVKGDVSFTVVRRDGAPEPVSGSVSTPEPEPEATIGPDRDFTHPILPITESEAEMPFELQRVGAFEGRCGGIALWPRSKTGLVSFEVKGLTCDKAISIFWDWLDRNPEERGPEGWECESELVEDSIQYRDVSCSKDGDQIRFESR